MDILANQNIHISIDFDHSKWHEIYREQYMDMQRCKDVEFLFQCSTQ